MLILILLLIMGLFFVYVSQFNLMPVTVNLGWYVIADIPLFYVIVGSFLTGLVLCYLVLLVHDTSAFLKLRGKKNELKKNKDDSLALTKRVHQLELENQKLKHSDGSEAVDRHSL